MKLNWTQQIQDLITKRNFEQVEKLLNELKDRIDLILDSDDLPRFLKLSNPRENLFSWGHVSSTGTNARDGSSDWSVSRTGVGTYIVTLPTVATQSWLPVVTPVSANMIPNISLVSASGFTVVFNTRAAGTAADTAFMFHAVARP